MSMSDAELLQRYVQAESAADFREIVRRHLDLVYSVARRQTGSPSLAEDIAQNVFIELARHARAIKPGTPLVAWLHVVSRRTALNAVRAATRRQSRELAAAEFARSELAESAAIETMNSSSDSWHAVEPLLDEAVETLSEPDRTAILLSSLRTNPCATSVPRSARATMRRKNASPAPSIGCARFFCAAVSR